METTNEFERRAFSAAGPVFLVSLGLVMLVAWALVGLLPMTPPIVAWGFGMGGLALVGLGIAWGGVQEARSRKARGGRRSG